MRKEIYLILDNIRSRENVGSIFRTADAVGVSKVYLCGITPTPKSYDTGNKMLYPHHDRIINSTAKINKSNQFFDKISKTALGAEKWVPWEYRAKTWQVLRELKVKSLKFKVIGLEQTKTSQSIFKFKPEFPLALVLGNEVRGLSPQILNYCDKKISIPMYGKKESLNVSVATGVALYIIKEHGS